MDGFIFDVGLVKRGWCWRGNGAGDGGAVGVCGARGAVRGARAGAMRALLALLVACWCALVAARDLRVLQADARAVFFVGIAAPASAAAVVRAFNRSLAEVSHAYFAADYPLHLRNITLQPLYIELPEDER